MAPLLDSESLEQDSVWIPKITSREHLNFYPISFVLLSAFLKTHKYVYSREGLCA